MCIRDRSNPVCSPRFRASASVTVQRVAFATGVLPYIYAFHRYTWSSTYLYNTQVNQFPMPFRSWAPGFHIRLNQPSALALRPINPDNARDIRITAAAGTYLAVPFWYGTVELESFPILAFLPIQQCFTTLKPSSHTRRCSIRLSPIVEDSLLQPPVGVWAVSQSQCGRSVSQLGYASLSW